MSQELIYNPNGSAAEVRGAKRIPLEKFKPEKGWYVVEMVEPEKETEGGISLPDHAVVASCVGQVVCTPEQEDDVYVKGEWLLLTEEGGQIINIGSRDKTYRIVEVNTQLNYSDVLGVLSPDWND